MKQALFFVTHLFDEKIEKRFKKILSETETLCDVYIATNSPDVIPDKYSKLVRTWTIEDMHQKNPQLISSGYLGNCHMTPLLLQEKVTGYDFFWFVEYDVVYTGNWGDIITTCIKDNADLICTHLRRYSEKEHALSWTWWKFFSTGNDILEDEAKISGFFPVYRISTVGIYAIQQSIHRGWRGHFESIIPTAIYFNKGIIHELGGTNSFTPKKRKGYFYSTRSTSNLFLEFRYRPRHIFCFKKNTLYHPVKPGILSNMNGEYWGNEYLGRYQLLDGRNIPKIQHIQTLIKTIIKYILGLLFLFIKR